MPTHGYAHAKLKKFMFNSKILEYVGDIGILFIFYFCILASHNLSWWSMHIKSQTAGIMFIFLINSRDSLSLAMFCKAPVQPSAISIMLIPSWSFSSSVPTISRTAADRSFTKCEMISWFLKEKVNNLVELKVDGHSAYDISFSRKTLYFGSKHRPISFMTVHFVTAQSGHHFLGDTLPVFFIILNDRPFSS